MKDLLLSFTLLCALGACSSSSEQPATDGGLTDRGSGADAATDSMAADMTARSWTVSEVDKKPVFKSRSAVAVGSDGEPQLVYNVATSSDGWSKPELWYAKRNGASWKTSQLVASDDGTAIEFPTIIVDGNGRTHVFFNRFVAAQQQIELYYTSSDDQQTFSAPINLTQTPDVSEYAPVGVLEGQDTIHLLFQRDKDKVPGIGYLKIAKGAPQGAEEVAADSQTFSLSPDYSLAVANGTVYAIYGKASTAGQFETVLHWRKRTQGGAWSPESALSATDGDAWAPAMATDAQGVVHVSFVAGSGETKTLTYDRIVAGAFQGQQKLSSSDQDQSYYLGMKTAADGTVHIAYTRFYLEDPQDPGSALNGDAFHISGKGGVFGAEKRLTETPTMDEAKPSIAVGPTGAVFISFVENLAMGPAGVVYLASFQ